MDKNYPDETICSPCSKKNCLNLLEIWLLEGDFVINALDVL